MDDTTDRCSTTDWLPVDPRALTQRGNVFRCGACRALVLEIDRDDHHCAARAA